MEVSHTDFNHLILSLIRIKEELYRVKEPKLQPLIGLLRTKNIKFIDGCDEVLTNKELAEELGITTTKCNSLLKMLGKEIKYSFFRNPLQVNEIECHICIGKHWRENHKSSNEQKKEEKDRYFSIDINLAVIPRVGEVIEFELADQNGYYRGIVYEVIHKVIGKKQKIIIFTHPNENEYYRWMRLKLEYDAFGNKKYG
jgi:hypothetical protein